MPPEMGQPGFHFPLLLAALAIVEVDAEVDGRRPDDTVGQSSSDYSWRWTRRWFQSGFRPL